jgi:hypothetical protein
MERFADQTVSEAFLQGTKIQEVTPAGHDDEIDPKRESNEPVVFFHQHGITQDAPKAINPFLDTEMMPTG